MGLSNLYCSELLRRSEAALVRRIAELDAEPPACDASAYAKSRAGVLLEHFIDIIGRVPGALIEVGESSKAIITATRADALVGNSGLLAEIGRLAPMLVVGPVVKSAQHWTTTGQAPWSRLPNWNGEPPSERRFVVPRVDRPVAIKPFGVGLWTSTACVENASMWRAYLESWKKNKMYLMPWHTWELLIDEDINVVEITSATRWVEFVCAYPRIHEGHLYPDWVKASQEIDAVHMTLPAIAAAQGFSFSTPQGVIPEGSWDVESTFWLKWRFSSARLMEKVREPSTVPARRF
jgi:hypothetical protein